MDSFVSRVDSDHAEGIDVFSPRSWCSGSKAGEGGSEKRPGEHFDGDFEDCERVWGLRDL